MKKILVVGAGVMGRGIAQVSASFGYEVLLCEASDEISNKAREQICWSLSKLAQKGKLQAKEAEILGRIQFVKDLSCAKDADFVIEAVFENLEIKTKIFRELDDICKPEVCIASNTSAIPITSLANATKRPEQVLGIHFFNPVVMMNMAEIVHGIQTSEESVTTAKAFVSSLDKKYCEVKKDVAGFVMNRIALCSTIEAIRLLEEGVATLEQIDEGMRMAYGWPMGPIETIDFTGLDVALGAIWAIYNETRDAKFLPPVTLCRLVSAGHFGKKTGKGFYDYTKNED